MVAKFGRTHLARMSGNPQGGWARKFKPEIAAILDDELARLNAEKTERKAAKDATKKGAA